MWPWLMIIAGVLLIVGALVARHRMMRDYHERLVRTESESRAEASDITDTTETTHAPDTTEVHSAAAASVDAPAEPVAAADADTPAEAPAPEPPKPPRPRITITEPSPLAPAAPAPTPHLRPVPSSGSAPGAGRASAAGRPGDKPQPLFADLPVGHRLTSPPTIRVRAQDVPLQDWLRYYADGNAWSGVIQSVSDRISGDRELQAFFGQMDRTTLQRHVMSTVMMLTGEGVTVGAVRRMADAHLQFVQAGGEPVTEPVWNRLAATFANALREHMVPESAISSLDATTAPLRSVIVARSPR